MHGALEREIIGRGAPGTRPQAQIGAGIAEGVIVAVTSAGITFTIPTFDDDKHVFGPAPWQIPVVVNPAGGTFTAVTPSTGDRVLAVFVGGFPLNPWIAAWWAD